MKNIPPFYVGQKIVRIRKNIPKAKIGQQFTCIGCFICGGCGDWKVLLKELPSPETACISTCKICKHDNGRRSYYNGMAIYFAPVEENTYENISKKLAVLPQDEVPDVKEIKELVN